MGFWSTFLGVAAVNALTSGPSEEEKILRESVNAIEEYDRRTKQSNIEFLEKLCKKYHTEDKKKAVMMEVDECNKLGCTDTYEQSFKLWDVEQIVRDDEKRKNDAITLKRDADYKIKRMRADFFEKICETYRTNDKKKALMLWVDDGNRSGSNNSYKSIFEMYGLEFDDELLDRGSKKPVRGQD